MRRGAAIRAVRVVGAIIVAANALLCEVAAGAEPSPSFDFNINEDTLGDALMELSRQARIGFLYPYDMADSTDVNPVAGRMTVVEALERLLRDTEFLADLTESEVIVVSQRKRESLDQMGKRNIDKALLAGVATLAFGAANAQSVETIDEKREERAKKKQTDEIVVTGTNIRGIAPESSPTQVFDREDIQISGAATVEDFLQTIPQNFGGGSNADVIGGLPNDFSASYNSGRAGTYGSSANLRGLGSGSTLVLLNNHRVAPSSGLGDFVDISLIPASAIQRVEVLTDGASSIYGGDAVAGVVNFILRDDFDGAEAMARYGAVTEGDLDEYRASLTVGENWETGNLLVAYEYFNRSDLSAGDRSFSQAAILPNDLFPSSTRHSFLAAGKQEIALNLEFSADFLYGQRSGVRDWSGTTYYIRIKPDTSTLAGSGALLWDMGGAWTAEIAGAYSRTDGEVPTEGDSTHHTSIDSSLWTLDGRTSGPLFGLWGGDLQLAIGSQYREESFSNVRRDIDTVQRAADRTVHAFFGEIYAPLVSGDNEIAGVHRLDLSVSGRYERYSDFGSKVTPKVGVLWSPVAPLRIRSSFGRSFNPPPLGRVGALDYTAFVAGTADINNVFGLTPADPSIADVTAIYVSGTARNLNAEESRTFTAGFDFNEHFGAHSVTIEATYLDIYFEERLGNTPVPGNRSVFDAPNIAFLDPAAFPPGIIQFFPTLDDINSLLSNVQDIVLRGPVDPLDAQIISAVQVTDNLSRSIVRGVDFDAGYRFESSIGDFSVGASGSYLIDYKQQASEASPVVSRIDTLYNPTHMRLRGRAGYSSGGLNANVFVNFTNSYKFDDLPGAQRVDSWTTVDFSLSYAPGSSFAGGVLGDTKVRLSVNNLFDTDPPSTTNAPTFSVFGYDPTNASPLNRFVALELSTQF